MIMKQAVISFAATLGLSLGNAASLRGASRHAFESELQAINERSLTEPLFAPPPPLAFDGPIDAPQELAPPEPLPLSTEPLDAPAEPLSTEPEPLPIETEPLDAPALPSEPLSTVPEGDLSGLLATPEPLPIATEPMDGPATEPLADPEADGDGSLLPPPEPFDGVPIATNPILGGDAQPDLESGNWDGSLDLNAGLGEIGTAAPGGIANDISGGDGGPLAPGGTQERTTSWPAFVGEPCAEAAEAIALEFGVFQVECLPEASAVNGVDTVFTTDYDWHRVKIFYDPETVDEIVTKVPFVG
mmetsp:Transcript_11756/g.17259  ORF Transcript_11756/g.17259 Transcript_11756/m.17259 type:complete len:301 (-) Transcript_11756:124-1026(-)